MRRSDWFYFLSLSVLAAFIWLRNTQWMSDAADTLPILVALPIFLWLGWPWKLCNQPKEFSSNRIALASTLFILGILFNLTTLLAASWTWLLFEWIAARVDPQEHPKAKKLLVLPFMAFPWIALDAQVIGWWFRISGASAASGFFTLLGAQVYREGTFLFVNQIPISVEAACSGLNTLQSMLIAGTAIAFLFLGESTKYWRNIPLLIVIAWLANTLRIIVLIAAALLVSPEFALGAFHMWGGWIVLMMMFGTCWFLFSWQEEPLYES